MLWEWARQGVIAMSMVVGAQSIQAYAEVYRWVDASGKVHFSDTAPNDQKVETIVLPESKPRPEATLTDSERQKRQAHVVKVLEEERLKKEKQRKEELAEKEKHIQYCKRFESRLKHMDTISVFYNENDDGTIQYLSDEEGDRYRREVKQQYQQECSDV